VAVAQVAPLELVVEALLDEALVVVEALLLGALLVDAALVDAALVDVAPVDALVCAPPLPVTAVLVPAPPAPAAFVLDRPASQPTRMQTTARTTRCGALGMMLERRPPRGARSRLRRSVRCV
jgi:hypothetical protein